MLTAMKPKAVLVVFIVLNIALVGAVVYLAGNRSRREQVSSSEDTHIAAAPKSESRSAETSLTVITNQSGQSFDWRVVESEDYRKYIANLRAVGCPEETIRDIIIADVNKLFEDRRKNLFGVKTNRLEYWKRRDQWFAQAFDEEKIKSQQELAKEKRAVLKELLGVEPEEKPDLMDTFVEMFDFLTPSKRTEVMELEQRFSARLMKSMSDPSVGDGMKESSQVQKEKEAELARLLSLKELEDYHLRMSDTAMRVREQLASFDPNEQEFREIFKLRKQIEGEFGTTPGGTLGSASTEKMKEQIKRLLGDSRYADYERSQDDDYQTIYRLADRNGLGTDAANKVYDMKRAAEDQAKAARMDTSLTGEQRDAALFRIRRETESAVSAVFGNEAFHYLQSQNGYWLRNISTVSRPVSQ